ncbi:MAG: hypothetical protein JNK69_13825 [Saprospiraceae bacterium]|nr:hypothetical protein [Saprospiraceae bacterium]
MLSNIKLGLAILFFICLLDMPYGYFQFVRIAALLVFSLLAYHASNNENKSEMILYIALAILFQPIIKIALGRTIWNIVDVIVGAWLVYQFMNEKRKKEGI